MSKDQLESCPQCGQPPMITTIELFFGSISCGNEKCPNLRVVSFFGEDTEEAITKWNENVKKGNPYDRIGAGRHLVGNRSR